MAADILLYQATKVPVGDDQTQHLELAHDLIERLNNYAGLALPVPSNIKSGHQRVMSLVNADNKMSKSDPAFRSRITLVDDAEMIREKVKRAKSDSFGAITYDPARKELYNLLNIYASIKSIDPGSLEGYFADDNMFSFKMKLADALIDAICPIGERYHALLRDEGYILEALQRGAKEANAQAERTLSLIRNGLKILPKHIQ